MYKNNLCIHTKACKFAIYLSTTKSNGMATEVISNYVTEQLKKHGLLFVLLLSAVYFLNEKWTATQSELKSAQMQYEKRVDSELQYLKDNRTEMIKVIENNTKVMERVARDLEK